MKMQHRKKQVSTFLCFSIILFAIMLVGCNSKTKSILEDYDITQDDWAFNNIAQEVDGIAGAEGIDINILSAWKDGLMGSKNAIVAVVDTGADASMSSWSHSIYENENEILDEIDNDGNGFVDDTVSWDFYNNDNSVYDDMLYDYHGSYICAMINKIASTTSILPVKFMKGSSGKSDDAVAAIAYAISRGARIINCSWNMLDDNPKLRKVIEDHQDILFVCSAGNTNINLEKTDIYPPSYNTDNIITVMSIDNNGNIYEGSGYGGNVDIAAPGVHILVDLPEGDSDYVDGTSVSAAFVSGTAALLLSIDDSLSPYQIKKIINDSARPLSKIKEKCVSGGMLDISKSVKAVHPI
jgi:subtilisin family serine protease